LGEQRKRTNAQLRLRLFNLHLIHKTPHPVLARFDGLHDGMFCGVKMFRCVLVFGRIAASDMAALAAKPQVNPTIAHLQAFFATCALWPDIPDVTGM